MNNNDYKRQIIEKSYNFSIAIIKFISSFNQKDLALEVVGRQLMRSATSIGANIVEAQAASSRKDFALFLTHALKSTNKTRCWLGILRDSGKSEHNATISLLQKATELGKLLGLSVKNIKRK